MKQIKVHDKTNKKIEKLQRKMQEKATSNVTKGDAVDLAVTELEKK